MLNGKKIVVVMPAYNAEKTLERTYKEIPFEIVDDVILVDDASRDRTSRNRQGDGNQDRRSHREPRIRWQPEDLLPDSPGARSGHRHHGAP